MACAAPAKTYHVYQDMVDRSNETGMNIHEKAVWNLHNENAIENYLDGLKATGIDLDPERMVDVCRIFRDQRDEVQQEWKHAIKWYKADGDVRVYPGYASAIEKVKDVARISGVSRDRDTNRFAWSV